MDLAGKSAIVTGSSMGIGAAIAPRFWATRMTDSIPPQIKAKILSRIPLKRFDLPEETAYVTLFLASDRYDYMTGQVLSVNGGLHL